MIFSKIKENQSPKMQLKHGFTLPEVIISFSILAMVVTSAVGVLSLVMRTNADNVSGLVANGLAQEGIEAVRFIRDSNVILGLDFDGSREDNSALSVWGEKLFDSINAPKYFKLINKEEVGVSCTTIDLQGCLPVALEAVSGSDLESFANNEETQVYLDKPEDSGDFRYFQKSDFGLTQDGKPSPYHRVIRIEPLKVPEMNPEVNVMRVSSIVFWTGSNQRAKKLVLTTDLTNWR